MRIPRHRALVGLLFFQLLLTAWPLRLCLASRGPVEFSELDLKLRAGDSTAEIIAAVQARGLAQPLDLDTRQRLSEHGADPALLRWLDDPQRVADPAAVWHARAAQSHAAEQTAAERTAAIARAQALGHSLPVPASAAPAADMDPSAEALFAFQTDFDAACKQAKAEEKGLFIVFTTADEDPGSVASRRLRENVRLPEFLGVAVRRFIGVRLICPRATDSVAAGSLAARNRAVLPLYNVTRLPAIVIADSGARRIGKLARWEESSGKFLEEFNYFVNNINFGHHLKVTPPSPPKPNYPLFPYR